MVTGIGGTGPLRMAGSMPIKTVLQRVGIRWQREGLAMIQQDKFSIRYFKKLLRLFPKRINDIISNAQERINEAERKYMEEDNYKIGRILGFPVCFLSEEEADGLARLFGDDFFVVDDDVYDVHLRQNATLSDALIRARDSGSRNVSRGFYLARIKPSL